ncbi:MAG: nuclear transport factor 2 family protein [Chloroflexi bacterium]|nr:nuclear transport factor 2 family protein [Chloroflexota bacterium]
MQPDTIFSEEQFQQIYAAFNQRELEMLLVLMQPDVQWANGMEGGFVYGRDAVRQYWTNQFTRIRSQVTPLKVEQLDDGRQLLTVHQVVYDLQGNLLNEQTVQHIYTIENGLVRRFEIGDSAAV